MLFFPVLLSPVIVSMHSGISDDGRLRICGYKATVWNSGVL